MNEINLAELRAFSGLLLQHQELVRLIHEIVLLYAEEGRDEDQ